ncbi:MAG TPA: hypothetical protein PLZ18_11110 [Ferruginibacter sp.]|nr:hypothetical protein [Ferruginibacter sp.]
MTPAEEREIKGISLKSLFWLLGSTITIVATVMGIYSGIGRQFDNLSNKVERMGSEFGSNNRISEMRIKQLEVRLDALELQIDNLQQKK